MLITRGLNSELVITRGLMRVAVPEPTPVIEPEFGGGYTPLLFKQIQRREENFIFQLNIKACKSDKFVDCISVNAHKSSDIHYAFNIHANKRDVFIFAIAVVGAKFELVIDYIQCNGSKQFEFQNMYEVSGRRSHFLILDLLDII